MRSQCILTILSRFSVESGREHTPTTQSLASESPDARARPTRASSSTRVGVPYLYGVSGLCSALETRRDSAPEHDLEEQSYPGPTYVSPRARRGRRRDAGDREVPAGPIPDDV